MITFYDSSHNRPARCLEFSELAVVDGDYGTASPLSMAQPPDTATIARLRGPEGRRIDGYLQHLRQERSLLPPEVHYLTAEGDYAKQTFVDGVCEVDLHLMSNLRHDANLRYLYTGPQQRRGRPKRYDGNVNLTDLRRLTPIPRSDDVTLYTAVVNSVRLRRDIRFVYVCKRQGKKLLTALLFSPDTTLAAEELSLGMIRDAFRLNSSFGMPNSLPG